MFLFATCIAGAQDPFFGIKHSMPMFFNPAYAGNSEYTRATLNYRNHYPASGTNFATYSASFDTYIDHYNSGLGLTLMSDQLGSKVYSYNSAGLFYSYKIMTGEDNYLKAGLMTNLYYGIYNPEGLLFPDMVNPDGSREQNQYIYEKKSAMGVDFGFGGMFSSEYFEAGAAVYHLGNENDALYWSRPLKIYVHTEWKIPLFNAPEYFLKTGIAKYLQNSSLHPSVFFIHQKNTTMWGVGALYQFLNFNLGLYSRQNLKFNTVTASLQIGYISDLMDINYMFDLGFTGKNYRGIATSSHEIGVTFKFSTGRD
jgi:type IX secretion system PorP/SprF family membrane protein